MEMIYEDPQILVCYKEAGLPVQSGRIGQKDLVSILKNRLWEQGGEKGEPYLGVIHRLDQPVEGLLVFAKTQKAAAFLSAQAADGRMKKQYLAAAWQTGSADGPGDAREAGILEDFLYKDNRNNCSRIVPRGTKGAKSARLEFRILERVFLEEGELDLVWIRLFTGRHHQIRVQLAGAGMPLAGDRKYGKDLLAPAVLEYPLALCAVSLEFIHPGSKKRMEFHCIPRGRCFQLLFPANLPKQATGHPLRV